MKASINCLIVSTLLFFLFQCTPFTSNETSYSENINANNNKPLTKAQSNNRNNDQKNTAPKKNNKNALFKLIDPQENCAAIDSDFQQNDNINSNTQDHIYFSGYGRAQGNQKSALDLKKEARSASMIDLAKNIQVVVESECINTIKKGGNVSPTSEFQCINKTKSNLKLAYPNFWREYFDPESCVLQTRAFIIKTFAQSIIQLSEAERLYEQSGKIQYTALERKQFIEQSNLLLSLTNFEDLKSSLPIEHYEDLFQRRLNEINKEILNQRIMLMINPQTSGLKTEDARYLMDAIQKNVPQSYYQNNASCADLNECFAKTRSQAYQTLSIISYKINYKKALGLHQGEGELKIHSYQRKDKNLILESDPFRFIGVNKNKDAIDWQIAIDKLMTKSKTNIHEYFVNLRNIRKEIDPQ